MGSTKAAVNAAIIIGAVLLFSSLHIDASASLTDVDNCGKSHHKCPPAPPHSERTCKHGKCNTECKRGWLDCDRKKATGCEVNVETDVKNCGSCDNVCPVPLSNHGSGEATCTNGVCGYTLTCEKDHADCDADPSNGCEIDLVGELYSTIENCGSCGNVCPASTNETAFAICDAGKCSLLCKFFGGFLGVLDCDNDMSNFCETNGRTDVNNCGGCGNVCLPPPAGQGELACNDGVCTGNCVKGRYEDCDGVASNGCEAELMWDTDNCGSCGLVCPSAPNATPICDYRGCRISCNDGYSDCDGVASNGCEVHGVCPNA
ncbi:hypothetical protein M758_1G295000 [Ceratodon purpureus]|nr:hypothetical protein M758_1G295000 [Ceratodon purpureus]